LGVQFGTGCVHPEADPLVEERKKKLLYFQVIRLFLITLLLVDQDQL
jgi:hypothetical protein